MIKKLIDKLLGKTPKTAAEKDSGAAPAGKRVEVPKSEHRIDPSLVDERAVKVVSTLADAGYEAYIVGGAVRDLLAGMRPKDFDVATDATPEQVKALFHVPSSSAAASAWCTWSSAAGESTRPSR